ncbi:MAG: polysaccharide biosynthesis tyrosine autokinase, partial [Steroidobacteraceae bacterium]
AEGLRTLRSELLMRWFGEHGSTLAVVAAREKDGSSLLTANLAITFAQLGERTLVIDLNLRNPSQHLLFGTQAQPGVADLLGGRELLEDISPPQPFPNLFVLSAGVPAPNPQELLSGVQLARLLTELSSTFDAIILDTPPLLKFADAQLIAARAGASLLVAHRHATRVRDIERMKTQLHTSGSTLIGAVLRD